MSKIEVNQISSQCGSTLTIGQSGDTVTLACGASQTGFGRTGTVNWDTTAKTAGFTAVSGNGYFVNTTSGAITVTLPATPSSGDIVGIKDYAGTFATNNVTVGRNGSNIDNSATDATLNTDNLSVFFVYVDGTQGWKATQSDSGFYGAAYVTATGGTITTCGDYKIHTFTGPGTFTVTCAGNPAGSSTVDYLVVAGGAGGGRGVGGGGGAGGYRESSGTASGCYTTSPLGACVSALPVTVQGYPITVGGGGAGGSGPGSCGVGSSGNNSIFSCITSAGGGGGATDGNCAVAGGSGGGQRSQSVPNGLGPPGGAGNTPPVSPPQGNTGGRGYDGISVSTNSAGGGGATAIGGNASCKEGGPGGAGATSSINGTPTTRAGGGGGGTDGGSAPFQSGGVPGLGGSGGPGGGGAGNPNRPDATPTGTPGSTNTGGGGGGGGSPSTSGGSGGSGIVIIRYKYQ